MAEAAFNLLPESQMGFVGLARNEQTHEPEAYMASLPESLAGRPVIVLDPMLATGGSLLHCIELLASRGASDITVVCVLGRARGHRAARDERASGAAGDGEHRRGTRTRTPTSCPASAMPATGNSARADRSVPMRAEFE